MSISVASFAGSAAAITVPSPPFINVEGVPNFRDIGGYAVSTDGASSVRRGFVYRSAIPTKITARGVNTLVQDLKVRSIYDLRSNAERRRDSASSPLLSPNGDGENGPVQLYHIPVFEETDLSPAQLAKRYAGYMSDQGSEGFVYAYREILNEGVNAYRRIFEHVRDRPTEPFLLHCTGGKDRTGVIAALMLVIAGVTDPNVVAEEYALTELGFDPAVRKAYADAILKDPAVKGHRAGVERMLSAKKENLLASLAHVDQEYGGVEGYLKQRLGFSDEDVAAIRKNLTSNEKPIL
jgi:protein tyrosine/serine phosphatase